MMATTSTARPGGGRRGLRRLAAVAAVAAVALPACGVARSDVPISFRADRRLKMVSPRDEERVRIPTTVRWSAKDFSLADGNHYGVFVDRVPLGPTKLLRQRICTEQEKSPIQPGENRRPCKDDRRTIFMSSTDSYTFTCFEPKLTAPSRTRNLHQVTIVLLDKDNRRIGSASSSVRFDVNAQDERKCRGLPPG